jgi:RNA polymerase sigma-70 factor (ECF subfamily)
MDGVQRLPKRDPSGRAGRVIDEGSRDLADRLRAGDGTALLELFQREGKRAFALAYRILGDAATAEDAVQEAFAQLWQRAPRLAARDGRIEALLMTIVHHRAVDMVRGKARRLAYLPDAELLDRVDEEATARLERVEEAISTAALRSELRAALDQLPAEQRVILDHVYVWQRSLREIADIESIPLGTVKSRLRLAMAKLSRSLRNRAQP